MKKISRRLVMLIILSAMIIATAISVGVYALITSTSSRGNIDISTTEVTATTQYSSSTGSYSLTYEAAGDAKTITISTTNQSGVVLHNIYNVEATSGDDNLKKAILVYFNDEYIGTLAELTTVPLDIENKYSFIPLTESETDTLKFELHQAAEDSLFDGKTVTISVTTITQNADYLDYIYVTNEETFSRAIDDVNSGLFSVNPTIVICNNVTLTNSYTIKNPTTIYLNGTLNGSLTINDDNTTSPDALLEILGNSSINGTITLGSYYDEDGAKSLVFNHIKDVIGEALSCGSTTNILGPYSFYGLNITVGSNCQYTSPNIIIANTSNEYYSKVASIVVEDETIEFKVLGSKSELIDATLAHLPNDGDIVSTDLFLPTYIKDQNATITWKSSDEDIISSQGKIAATRLENAQVSLLAEIKINDTVVTRTFDFKVSVHNNEINFYKLVQEISPIVIANVYNDASDADDALYHLPIVSQNSDGTFNDYDYRTSYKSPVNTQLFNWAAFKDIGIESITYSMTAEQQAAYDYITQSGNTLYLNTETLNSFARITITGDFGNDETYSTYINISISVGSNTQLLEKAFQQVSSELAEISVLGNILSTRISNGMANEKGDFSLSSQYYPDQDYTIEYSGAATIIDSITYNQTTGYYDFAINPEYFNEYETTVSFVATVYYKKGTIAETSKSRTFYINVPAALHVSTFGTLSLYESIKYQTFSQLPSSEKSGTSGYTTSGSVLSDSNINYILIRDIVGDTNYITEYDTSDGYYLEVCRYTSQAQYASGVSTLKFLTRSSNDTNSTDQAAYDFARLIEWATGDSRATALSVVTNTAALGSLSSTKANAESYLNDKELAVIKQVYKYYTGASDSDWNNIYLETFNEAPGYVFTNPELLNTVLSLLNGKTSTSYSTLFGKYMEVLQRYAVSTTKVNTNDVAPCQGVYNTTYVWYHSSTRISSFTMKNYSNNTTYTFTNLSEVQVSDGTYWYRANWQGTTASDTDGAIGGYYATTEYAADRTSYITKAELMVLEVFWANEVGLTNTISTTNIQTVLTNDNGKYYEGYSTSDFNTCIKAVLNAFDACLELPTYFTGSGVSTLMEYFYNNYNYSNKKYELSEYGETPTTFKTSISDGIPYITNADSLKASLSYFTNLTTLEFYGNTNLATFLSDNGLATLFARTSLVNTNISRLVMQNVAHANSNFDLTNIKNFSNLTYLDLSNNLGIQSINELVNVNRGQYTYVNIQNIGVEYEYQEFAIDNIATSTCTVHYTNASSVNTYTNDSSNASDLADLSDFNKFISKYMYMTNVIYNDDGSTTTINWRIDEGNELYGTVTSSGKYPEINSVEAMNKFISPYYYCTEDFTYTYGDQTITFRAKKLYKAEMSGSQLNFNAIGTYDSINALVDSSNNVLSGLVDDGEPDYTDFIPETTTTESENVVSNGTETVYQTQTWYTKNPTTNNVTITFNSYKMSYSSGTGWWSTTYYLYKNNNTLGTTTTSSNGLYFFFLTSNEVDAVLNKTYASNTTIGANPNNNLSGTYYMCYLNNNTLTFVGTTASSSSWSDIYFTTTKTSACTYTITNKRLKSQANTYIYTDYFSSSYTTWTFSSGTSSYSYTTTYNPKFELHNSDGTYTSYTAYQAGYTIYKVSGYVSDITQTQKTVVAYKLGDAAYYLYTGNNVTIDGVLIKTNTIVQINDQYIYPVATRSRTLRISADYYYWVIWYYETSGSAIKYINVSDDLDYIVYNDTTKVYKTSIDDLLPENSVTQDYTIYPWDEWDDDLVSTWQYNKTIAKPYISYVESISDTAIVRMNLDDKVELYNQAYNNNISLIYRYTGTTGSELVYKQSTTGTSTSYTNNYGYKLAIDNGLLKFDYYTTITTNNAGTNSMDAILTEANQHFKDYLYGSYYGRYYAYSGTAKYISSGIYVQQYYIYRIMPNSANTAFEWVEIQKYTIASSDNILINLGTGELGVGDIVYSNATSGFGFFTSGFYKIIQDEKTHIVNLVKYNDMGITINGESTYTMLTNDKLVQRSGDYLGYSGTFTVQITALIRITQADGTVKEYTKIYKMKFVGALYD